MMYHDKLYAVKNDRGEFAHIEMDELTWETGFATVWLSLNKPYAERTSSDYGGHVVELIEAQTKVVVSEVEAKMLKNAKNTTVWRPASVIAGYAYEHEQQGDDEALLEDRLMRAYVNGWTVDKPKRWNVKAPHVNNGYYYKDSDGLAAFTAKCGRMLQERSQFTLEEIEHYGLQDCEKEEVTEDDE